MMESHWLYSSDIPWSKQRNANFRNMHQLTGSRMKRRVNLDELLIKL